MSNLVEFRGLLGLGTAMLLNNVQKLQQTICGADL